MYGKHMRALFFAGFLLVTVPIQVFGTYNIPPMTSDFLIEKYKARLFCPDDVFNITAIHKEARKSPCDMLQFVFDYASFFLAPNMPNIIRQCVLQFVYEAPQINLLKSVFIFPALSPLDTYDKHFSIVSRLGYLPKDTWYLTPKDIGTRSLDLTRTNNLLDKLRRVPRHEELFPCFSYFFPLGITYDQSNSMLDNLLKFGPARLGVILQYHSFLFSHYDQVAQRLELIGEYASYSDEMLLGIIKRKKLQSRPGQ